MTGWLERHKDLGILLMRLFIGVRLLYGVLDNVLSWDHMLEFKTFLSQLHFPYPLLSAIISVYAQLIAGLMILIGWKIRPAAGVMIINFFVALLMVHRGDSFEQMTPPLAMLASSLLFLFYGSGRYSLDGWNTASPSVFKPQKDHRYIQRQ